MSRILFARIVSLLAIIISSPILFAQHGVRIAPETVSTTVVPDSLRYQAAYISGSRMVLAFATTRSDGHGGLVGEIRSVRKESGDTSAPAVLSATEARPSSGIAIRALRGGAVVFWSDVRNGERSIYAHMLDTALMPVGEEIRVCEGSIRSDSLVWLLDRGENDLLLIWDQSDGTGAIARLDDNLLPSAGYRIEHVDTINHVLTIPALPGAVLLSGANGRAGYFLRSDDRLDTRSIPERIAGSFLVVDADTSVCVARDSMVIRYASLFDTAMVWSRSVTMGQDYLPGRILATDSLGEYLLYFSGSAWYSHYWVPLYRTRFSHDGTPIDTLLIDSLQFVFDEGGYTPHVGISDAHLIAGCGAATLRLVFNITYVPLSASPNVWSTSWKDGFTVDESGRYRRAWDASVSECGREGLMRVTRSTQQSHITLTASYGTLGWSYATISVGLPSNAVQTNPVIVGVTDSTLVFSYQDQSADLPLLVCSWKRGSSGPGTIINGIGKPSDEVSGAQSMYSSCGQVGKCGAMLGLQTLTYVLRSLDSPYRTTYWEKFWANMPTMQGWRAIFSGYAYSDAGTPGFYSAVAHRADGPGILALNNAEPNSGHQIDCLDEQGNTIWSNQGGDLEQLWPTLYLIPLGGRRYIAVQSGAMFLMDSSHLVRKWQWASVNGLDQYWMLDHGHFLHTHPLDSGLTLQIFDTSGTFVNAMIVNSVSSLDDITIVDNTAAGYFIVIWGSPRGLRGWVISHDLQFLRGKDGSLLADIPLVDTACLMLHPSARFVGDSLVMIWEDHRNGAPDIFGCSRSISSIMLGLKDFAPEGSHPLPSTQILAVEPNPASTGITIEIAVEHESEITLDLVDPLGRRLLRDPLGRLAPGVLEHHLDMSGLPPGTYFLTIRNPDGVATVPVVLSGR